MRTSDDLRQRLTRPDQGDAPMAVGTEGFTADHADELQRDGAARIWRCECCGTWLVRLVEPST